MGQSPQCGLVDGIYRGGEEERNHTRSQITRISHTFPLFPSWTYSSVLHAVAIARRPLDAETRLPGASWTSSNQIRKARVVSKRCDARRENEEGGEAIFAWTRRGWERGEEETSGGVNERKEEDKRSERNIKGQNGPRV